MRIALCVFLLAALFGCADTTDAPDDVDISAPSIPIDIDGELSFLRGADTLKTIAIEIADTDSTRARGLMQRDVIPEDTGMLFVFPREEPQGFYMANTPRSLDIQYYAADSTLVNIVENTTPYSHETLLSEGPAQFVVEVPAGVSRRIGLVPGDRITWAAD